jgi:oligoribonuclease NrnB/cAMP/cGMP phosphodiesterase (DHH superfamily)
MKTYFHRIDFDGICSGMIVKYKYPDCELFGVDHSDCLNNKFWKEQVKKNKNETFFMVDFSCEQMNFIKNNVKHFIWIDHHKTAIEKYGEYNFEGYRRIDLAACQLTWNYLFPDKKIPYIVNLLGYYDIWKHEEDKRILPFQNGMKIYSKKEILNVSFWKDFFNEEDNAFGMNKILNICKNGSLIEEYKTNQNEIYCQEKSFETEIEGYRAICCNMGLTNSQLFNSVWNEEKYDLMCVFSMTKDKTWVVSLYTTKENIDVSEIAKKYSGGGHQQSCGFSCNYNDLFKFLNMEK